MYRPGTVTGALDTLHPHTGQPKQQRRSLTQARGLSRLLLSQQQDFKRSRAPRAQTRREPQLPGQARRADMTRPGRTNAVRLKRPPRLRRALRPNGPGSCPCSSATASASASASASALASALASAPTSLRTSARRYPAPRVYEYQPGMVFAVDPSSGSKMLVGDPVRSVSVQGMEAGSPSCGRNIGVMSSSRSSALGRSTSSGTARRSTTSSKSAGTRRSTSKVKTSARL